MALFECGIVGEMMIDLQIFGISCFQSKHFMSPARLENHMAVEPLIIWDSSGISRNLGSLALAGRCLNKLMQFRTIWTVAIVEGSLEVKLPTIWTDEKQSRAEAERRGRLEERRSEGKE